MKQLLLLLCLIIIAGCSATNTDLSKFTISGYQPNTTFQKERKTVLTEVKPIEADTLLTYQDGISFLITSDNQIKSIEAASELTLTDSRDGIRRGDGIDKVVQRFGNAYATRMEQGALIYSYQDNESHLLLEFWAVDKKVHTIRFKSA